MEDFKVRDTRNGEWFWANKLVLNHPYTQPTTKLVYLALAYFANNNTQKSYPSIEKISKLLGLSRPTVISSIKSLEEYHFIKSKKTQGKVSEYRLLKIIDERPVKKFNQLKREGNQLKKDTTPVKKGYSNKTNITRLNKETADAPSLLEELLTEKRRDLQIVGLWVRERKIDMPDKVVRSSLIKRNIRSAGLLKGYKDEDIVETIRVLRRTTYLTRFTLETVGKYIDEVVGRKKESEENPIIRFEEVKKDGKIIAMKPIYSSLKK